MRIARKKKNPYIKWLFSVALYILFLAWLLASISKTNSAINEQQINSLKQNIINASALCYSIEGSYPENYDYIADNYGVHYDKNKYIVNYEYFAANIRPNITVIEKGEVK